MTLKSVHMSLSIQHPPVVWKHKFTMTLSMQYKSHCFTETTQNIHIINMTIFKGFSKKKNKWSTGL